MKNNTLKTVLPSGNVDKQLFFEQVFQIIAQIPSGKVTTYGAIANCLGTKSGARMVGWALKASIQPPHSLPAHRVVNRQGLLSGKMHFDTPTTMQTLLEKEGIVVENDQIVHFDRHFWNPANAE